MVGEGCLLCMSQLNFKYRLLLNKLRRHLMKLQRKLWMPFKFKCKIYRTDIFKYYKLFG